MCKSLENFGFERPKLPQAKDAALRAAQHSSEYGRECFSYFRFCVCMRARHDFRAAEFGVYCIDGAGTSFLDDAFSVDPETREVFIHITDVQGLVPTGR